MGGTPWIDTNCMIGKQKIPHAFYAPESAGQIKGDLQRAGITKALAYHVHAKEYHPYDGNLTLMNDILNDDFYLPVWVLLPGHTPEFPSVDELGALFRKHRVVGARCFPSPAQHFYSMKMWCMGEMLDMLEAMKLPLFIDAGQIGWDDLQVLLASYTGLNVVLTNVPYNSARLFYPLLKKYDTLYLELSMIKVFLGVRQWVADFSSNRFLYGSGMPVYSPEACKYMIETAGLAPEDLENIAFRNITRILEGICYE